jgi:urease alpha subunit
MTGPANGSFLGTEPVKMRPQWGGTGAAPPRLAKVFTSRVGIEGAKRRQSPHLPRLVAVSGTRGIGKADLSRNGATPEVRVDPDSFVVTLDGAEAYSPPSERVPLSRRYLLV